MTLQKALNAAILIVASLIGLASFFYPFLLPAQAEGFGAMAHTRDAPLVFVVLVLLCLAAVLSSLAAGSMNTKLVAVLGVLTAANAVLRGVPGPGGVSLVFLLPILCGYAYGASFGFLLGVFSLGVSAFIGFGVGPWLPYQMLSVGWVGLLSGLLPRLGRRLRTTKATGADAPYGRQAGTKMTRRPSWATGAGAKTAGAGEAVMLAVWGLVVGILFGALMNIWFWPFVFTPGQSELYWQPGLGLLETLKRYAIFYGVTSLWWDLARAVGNFLLLLLFAAPVLRLLRRFQQRFYFTAT